jgi:hypothetical protein
VADIGELSHLKSAFARVDRNSSILSWAAAEPPAMTDWRRGLVLRVARSDVAAAILHALAPYHELLRQAAPTRVAAELRLPAGRVATVRRAAIMRAWLDHVRQIVSGDHAELGSWTRYWSAVSAPTGTREDSLAWQREVEARAGRGSPIAARVLEAVSERNDALHALDRKTARRTVIRVRVPGIG